MLFEAALWYLAAVSLWSAVLVWWDKRRARRGGRRVPERRLFLWAALGGSAAMYAAMRVLHHKTLHRRFMWGLPLIALSQCAAVWAVLTLLTP